MSTAPEPPAARSKSRSGIPEPQIDEIALELQRGRLLDKMFGIQSEPTRLGHYVIIQKLGRGARSVVYLAHDLALDRNVALEILLAEFSAATRSRLVNEAKATAKLILPNAVRVYGAGEFRGKVYIVMEYVDGCVARGPCGGV